MENIDRRGFFASLGAALLAPLAPLVKGNPVWPARYSKFAKYDIIARSNIIKSGVATLGAAQQLPHMALGEIGPFPYEDGVFDTAIPELTSFAELVLDDPFQTFQVDTSNV